jgi:cytochrome c peroxidase
MWNGSFGATHVNADYEDVWGIADAKTKINHLGFEGIESTNLEGIKVHRISANKELLTELGYIELFDAAFPEVAGQDTLYSTDYAALALSAYIRTLMSHKAPFQQWLKGNNDALSLEEKKGAILFFSKANCSRCHFEQNLGSHEFHVLGVKDMFQRDGYNNNPNDLRNLGRAGFTMDDEDLYKFKVPGIYNMDDTRSYFHGASANTLREVLEYKIAAVSENPIISNSLLSPKFEPLTLTEQEISHLEAFLVTGLRDPDLIRFKPDNVPSGQCFPNADPSSIVDLGCQ